jgi:hypothetical protein
MENAPDPSQKLTIESTGSGHHIATDGDGNQTVIPPGGAAAHVKKHFGIPDEAIGAGLKDLGSSLAKIGQTPPTDSPHREPIQPRDEPTPSVDWNISKSKFV